MVVEAGLAAGYVVAWAVRKARRVAGRLDAETDAVIDGSLERLHEVVEARLAGHPVLAELVDEATTAGEVSELTGQRIELEITAAARSDEEFGQAVAELVATLREAGQGSRGPVNTGTGSAVSTGNIHVRAAGGSIAIGPVRSAAAEFWSSADGASSSSR